MKGITLLVVNDIRDYSIWIYLSFLHFFWIVVFFMTIFEVKYFLSTTRIQNKLNWKKINYYSHIYVKVARLNSKCKKFQTRALSSKVYGYGVSTPSEIDSFLLFVSVINLRVILSILNTVLRKILKLLNFERPNCLEWPYNQTFWYPLQSWSHSVLSSCFKHPCL